MMVVEDWEMTQGRHGRQASLKNRETRTTQEYGNGLFEREEVLEA